MWHGMGGGGQGTRKRRENEFSVFGGCPVSLGSHRKSLRLEDYKPHGNWLSIPKQREGERANTGKREPRRTVGKAYGDKNSSATRICVWDVTENHQPGSEMALR